MAPCKMKDVQKKQNFCLDKASSDKQRAIFESFFKEEEPSTEIVL